MDQVWTYRRGAWSTSTSPVTFTDSDGEQLEEIEGYDSNTMWLGLEGGFQVEVYTRLKDNRKATSEYLVIIYLGGDNRDYVFAEDLPSLLQLLNYLAPIIQCSNEDVEAEDEDEEDEFGADGPEDKYR
jgi:hypothetical protein